MLILGDRLLGLVAARAGPGATPNRPVLVAIDGRSGAGKSTLARSAAQVSPVDVSVIEGDDFSAGGTDHYWDGLTAGEKVAHCIDWRRQRPVLEALGDGRTASWHPFDWEAFDGSLVSGADRCPPAPVVILEGAYSARPELADLLDLRVLLDTSEERRRARLVEREGEAYADGWYRRWSEAEQYYFGQVMPPERFDLVLTSD